MTPQQELKLITGRLASDRKGIILFHDPKAQSRHAARFFALSARQPLSRGSRRSGWSQNRVGQGTISPKNIWNSDN
jgi:hypothetical protein